MVLHRRAFCLGKTVVLAVAVATLSLKLCGLFKTKKTLGLLPKRVVGALMRADLNAGKAGSLAIKASPTTVYYIHPTDLCISWRLLYGVVLNYTPPAFHWTK